MANHARYVPRVQFLPLILPLGFSTLFRCRRIVEHFVCGTRYNVSIVLLPFLRPVPRALSRSFCLFCSIFFLFGGCLHERFICHYSSYEANKKSDLVGIVEKVNPKHGREAEWMPAIRLCFYIENGSEHAGKNELHFMIMTWSCTLHHIFNTLAYLTLWSHIPLSLFLSLPIPLSRCRCWFRPPVSLFASIIFLVLSSISSLSSHPLLTVTFYLRVLRLYH